MPKLIRKTRFDEAGPEDGFVEPIYHGWNYEIEHGEELYKVRSYDDEPGTFLIISPTNAQRRPELGAVAQFLRSELGCTSICLFDETRGGYGLVEPTTLQFVPES